MLIYNKSYTIREKRSEPCLFETHSIDMKTNESPMNGTNSTGNTLNPNTPGSQPQMPCGSSLLHNTRGCKELSSSPNDISQSTIRAHKCVLSTQSVYFKTMLATTNFIESNKKNVYDIIGGNFETLLQVIDYFYTGTINIDMDNVGYLLFYSDFLGVDSLKEYCVNFLTCNINLEEVVFIASLVYRYNLLTIVQDIDDFISNMMPQFLEECDLSKAPLDFIRHILDSKELNYVEEYVLFDMVKKWLAHDDARLVHIGLLRYVNTSYLPKDVCDFNSDLINSFIKETSAPNKSGEDYRDVLLIKSHCKHRTDKAELLLYSFAKDSWGTLELPENFDAYLLNGFDDFVCNNNVLYILVTEHVISVGHVTNAPEVKNFLVYDLISGSWKKISLSFLRGKCRLTSEGESIFCIDQCGAVILYNIVTCDWLEVTSSQLYYPHQTMYILPFVVNNNVYILRCHVCNGQDITSQYFTLYSINISTGVHVILTHDCESGELGIGEGDILHGYSFKPEGIIFTDTRGQDRTFFSFSSKLWTPLNRLAATSDDVFLAYKWVRDVYAYTKWRQRSYYLVKHVDNNEDTILVMYDNSQQRLKRVQQPEVNLSAVMAIFTLPGSSSIEI